MIIDLANLNISQAVRLKEISKEIQPEFNRLCEEIYNLSDKSFKWAVHELLSRNCYFSNLFQNICYLELLSELFNNNNSEHLKIIVPNSALKKTLLGIPKFRKKNIKIISSESLAVKLNHLIHPYLTFANNILKSIIFLKLKNKKNVNQLKGKKKIILIDTFFIQSMFGNCSFTDRYYDGLIENVPSYIKERIYFTPYILINKKLKSIITIAENAKENFIFRHDFLLLKDYVYALTSPFLINKIDVDKIFFKKNKITKLLKHNLFPSASIFLALLEYRFIQRLKENNIEFELIIDWFENQPIDKAFNRGIYDFYPNVRVNGYLDNINFTPSLFYLKPTKYELNAKLVPLNIAVTGKLLAMELQRDCPFLNVLESPAFRYKDISNYSPTDSQLENQSRHIILCALPYTLTDSNYYLTLLANAALNTTRDDLHFLIKPHPINNKKTIESLLPKWPKNFEIVSGSFSKEIQKAELYIGGNSSATIEALAYDRPVIIIESFSGLSQNPIPDIIDQSMWKSCFSPDEILFAIDHFLTELKNNKSKYRKYGEFIRSNFFNKVTMTSVKQFLQID